MTISTYLVGFGVLLLIIAIFYGIFKWVSEDPSRQKKSSPPIKPMPTSNKTLDSQRDELLQLLDQLKKRLVEGAISEETYQELRSEYQEQLDDIQRKLNER
jgi:hypothetical protein